MNYYVPQIKNDDCGFACLKMMIANLYQKEEALFIKQDESHGPYSLQDLKNEAEPYGVMLNGIELANKYDIKEMKFPFIALLKEKNEVYHYVLVTKVKFGSVYYLDPSEGQSMLSIKAFIKAWSGECLMIEDFNQLDISFPRKIEASKKSSISIILLQFISAFLLVVGIYYIDDKTKVYVPLCFLFAAFVAEIILRVMIVKQMEKMDKDILRSVNVEKKQFSCFYERYEEYKKLEFSSKMNLAFSFIIIIFITSITLINNMYNVFVVTVPLFLSIIDTQVIYRIFKDNNELISIDEAAISEINNVDVFKRQVDTIHLKGYRLARIFMLKKYIYVAIIALTALLTTIFNETFSLPYLIFYSVIGYTLLEQYTSFLNYPRYKNELLKAKVRLNNVTYDI